MFYFTKMHANGNDFMLIDNWRANNRLPSADKVRAWANRYTGIGFDQLLHISTSTANNSAAVFCHIFNADGTEAEQCGHGMACVAQFVYKSGYLPKRHFWIETIAGVWEVKLVDDQYVIVNLGYPQFNPQQIPFIGNDPACLQPLRLSIPNNKNLISYMQTIYQAQHQLLSRSSRYLELKSIVNNEKVIETDFINEAILYMSAVSLGNPHCVVMIPDVDQDTLLSLGGLLSQHTQFPKGTNVEWMEVIHTSLIKLRVYERGVGETQACGSGACAAVVVGRLLGYLDEVVTVKFTSGFQVIVNCSDFQNTVQLKTKVHFVFQGQV